MVTVVLAAESRLSSMFAFFFVALLLISPFAYRQMRAVVRLRRGHLDEGADQPDSSASPAATRPDDLSAAIAAIAAAADDLRHEPDAGRTVTIPATPTVGGRPAPAEVVRALLDDAVRRSGLAATSTPRTDGGTDLHLTRLSGSPATSSRPVTS